MAEPLNKCLFRVNFVAKTSIVVSARTGIEAENIAVERIAPADCDWEVESSEVIDCAAIAAAEEPQK
jgi:hypothetical protein